MTGSETDHAEPKAPSDGPAVATSTAGAGRRRPVRVVRLALSALGALLCLVAIPLPLWTATLDAPQYHEENALRLTAYGDRLVGDICELNDLNHYIGMSRLGEPSVPCGSTNLPIGDNTVGRIAPEMALWLPGAILSAGAVFVAVLTRRRVLRWLALVWLWGLPLGVLVMTQYHLYVYGHDLDRTAAFRPDSFTPRVVGPNTIYQFHVDARPGIALLLVVAAAAIATFGPWLWVRYGPARLVQREGS